MNLSLLIVFIALFGAVHLVPALPGLKSKAQQSLGKAYGPVYGIATLAALGLTLWAYRQATPTAIYTPPPWGYYANFGFSLVGFVFIGIFLFRGSWRNTLKYPMAYGVGFWALGHLFARGDDRSLILFLGLALFGGLHAALKSRQGLYVPSEERQGHNTLSIMAGVVLYGIAAQVHYVIAGVHVVTLQ
jgi:uncharacterized membrane protein